jgi:hypothetical protein
MLRNSNAVDSRDSDGSSGNDGVSKGLIENLKLIEELNNLKNAVFETHTLVSFTRNTKYISVYIDAVLFSCSQRDCYSDPSSTSRD